MTIATLAVSLFVAFFCAVLRDTVISNVAEKTGTIILLYHLLGFKMTRQPPLGCAIEQILLCIHVSWSVSLTNSKLLEDR